MDSPLLKATPTGSRAQVPVPRSPVTTGVLVAGGSRHRLLCPITEASRTGHASLLHSASTGPGALAPGLHLPLLAGLRVAAHAPRGRDAGQELAVKRPQAAVLPVHALSLPDPEAPAAVPGALAPVSHSPAGAGTEVASLGGVRPLHGRTVGIHLGAALHAAPVGPQPARGGTLTPVSNDPVRRAAVRALPVTGDIQQKALGHQTGHVVLGEDRPRALCGIHAAGKLRGAVAY